MNDTFYPKNPKMAQAIAEPKERTSPYKKSNRNSKFFYPSFLLLKRIEPLHSTTRFDKDVEQ